MPKQLNLPGLDAATLAFAGKAEVTRLREPLAYTLFLALFPSPSDATRIAERADLLRRSLQLSGDRLGAGRLHVTLMCVYRSHSPVSQAVVDAAIAATAAVDWPPMDLMFDRALSFDRSDAFVLRCDAASDHAVAQCRQVLGLALRRVGLRPRPSSTPHITLLYEPQQHVQAQPIDPIGWTANELVLVLSHVGLTHHEWLARRTLRRRC